MSRIRTRSAPAAVLTAALTAALALTACRPSAGRASPPPPPPASGSPGAAAAGGVLLTAYTDNDGPTSTVLLTGKIGDHGTARSVNPDGSVNKDHTALLELDLAQGTFRIDIAALDRAFVGALANFPPDRTSCSGTASVGGTAPIVGGSGTGAYRGIAGTFRLAIALTELDVRPSCGGLVAQLLLITGTADVRYGELAAGPAGRVPRPDFSGRL